MLYLWFTITLNLGSEGGAATMSKNTNMRVKINKDGSLAIDLADESTRRQIVDAISPTNDDKIRSLQDKLRLLEQKMERNRCLVDSGAIASSPSRSSSYGNENGGWLFKSTSLILVSENFWKLSANPLEGARLCLRNKEFQYDSAKDDVSLHSSLWLRISDRPCQRPSKLSFFQETNRCHQNHK